ncbi:hypothetical protein Q8A73_001007 [Channa argus]|nr:hypothetical protein Q8A73_001007 [Channa argus]
MTSPRTLTAILPSSVRLTAANVYLEEEVIQALAQATSACPPHLLYVPEDLHSKVIHWCQASKLTCQPGTSPPTILSEVLSSAGDLSQPILRLSPTVQRSITAAVRCCHLAWRGACQTLLESVSSYEKWANKRCSPAQQYAPGQKVWLSTADFPLRVESKKVAPRFVGPFSIA